MESLLSPASISENRNHRTGEALITPLLVDLPFFPALSPVGICSKACRERTRIPLWTAMAGLWMQWEETKLTPRLPKICLLSPVQLWRCCSDKSVFQILQWENPKAFDCPVQRPLLTVHASSWVSGIPRPMGTLDAGGWSGDGRHLICIAAHCWGRRSAPCLTATLYWLLTRLQPSLKHFPNVVSVQRELISRMFTSMLTTEVLCPKLLLIHFLLDQWSGCMWTLPEGWDAALPIS